MRTFPSIDYPLNITMPNVFSYENVADRKIPHYVWYGSTCTIEFEQVLYGLRWFARISTDDTDVFMNFNCDKAEVTIDNKTYIYKESILSTICNEESTVDNCMLQLGEVACFLYRFVRLNIDNSAPFKIPIFNCSNDHHGYMCLCSRKIDTLPILNYKP